MRVSPFSMLAAAVIGAGLASSGTPAVAETHLEMIGFGGASNLPIWVAQDKGLFAKEGLDVKLSATKGSIAQMKDLMAGKYQVASTSIDNVIAYTEGQSDVKLPGYDIVGVAGVHSGLNSLVTRPEIKTWQDIKGKPVAVDALSTGYAFVLFKLLEKHGLAFGKDYTVISVGGGPERLEAMESKKAVAAVISAPNDTEAKAKGYNILADAAEALGGYQGSAYAVRRSWAKAHEKETVAWLRGLIAGHDYIFAHKAESIAVLRAHLKKLDEAQAETIYKSLTAGAGGLNKKAEINMAGMKTVLELRDEFGKPKKTLNDPSKYLDLTYYREALAGMK